MKRQKRTRQKRAGQKGAVTKARKTKKVIKPTKLEGGHLRERFERSGMSDNVGFRTHSDIYDVAFFAKIVNGFQLLTKFSQKTPCLTGF